MPSPKCREDFLRCQMCKHCYEHRCRDVSGQWISLCKKHHWPTYDPACPDWEEKGEDNRAKREFERFYERGSHNHQRQAHQGG